MEHGSAECIRIGEVGDEVGGIGLRSESSFTNALELGPGAKQSEPHLFSANLFSKYWSMNELEA